LEDEIAYRIRYEDAKYCKIEVPIGNLRNVAVFTVPATTLKLQGWVVSKAALMLRLASKSTGA
jgi:hypothetical protein